MSNNGTFRASGKGERRVYVNRAEIQRNRQFPDDMRPPISVKYPSGAIFMCWEIAIRDTNKIPVTLTYYPTIKEGSSCWLIVPDGVLMLEYVDPPEAD